MKVVLIGSGNVNTVLGRKIAKAGHQVLQVISRNLNNASQLAGEVGGTAADSLQQLNKEADIYILSVSDTVLPQVASELKLNNQLVVHTTGAGSMEIVKCCSTRYGVMYPLQSLRKNMDSDPVTPLFTDGCTEEVEKEILSFATTLSPITGHANDTHRIKLHVGAVLVSNFTNYLYAQAEVFCRQENIDFKALLPLIEETSGRLHHYSAADVQTGPAARKDMVTIEKHLQLLQPYPQLTELYVNITDCIINNPVKKQGE